MQRVFFSIKRVHWLWQKRAQEFLKRRQVWITPARFNLLRTLYTYRYGLTRQKLARLLGVAGPGVSRMVKALQEDLYVTRSNDYDDERYVRIRLTDWGIMLVEDVFGGDVGEMLDQYLEREVKRWFASSRYPDVDVGILDDFLIRARVRREDRAIYPVPWHGGEVLPWEAGTIQEPPPLRIEAA